ncbi:MAG TPA: 2-phospho-L-lactate transferase [Pseudolabrys sp.]|nr:2-phospho-L-lactate transferase [Pseudolabrys sp.]
MSGGAKVVALCGGVGGAKLALGLERRFGAGVTLIVNTGDDFEHLELHVSPDIDTVLYTLAGLSDPKRGWGRADETWHCMDSLGAIGGETWFKLGDRDLAMHLERTRQLRSGVSLTAFTAAMAKRLRISAAVVPMSDDPVSTIVHTDEGALSFQRYFVDRRCEPVLQSLEFKGAERARPAAAALAALQDPDLTAVIICPSNPYLSVDPILSIPSMRDAICAAAAPVIAVSPLIDGKAVKGPTAKIMSELKQDCTPQAIAHHYEGLIDGLIVDHLDRYLAAMSRVPVRVTATLMRDLEDRERLACESVAFAELLGFEQRKVSHA